MLNFQSISILEDRQKRKNIVGKLFQLDRESQYKIIYNILIDGMIPSESDANEIVEMFISHLSKIIDITYKIQEDNFIAIKGTCTSSNICHAKMIIDKFVARLDDGESIVSLSK